MFVIAQRGKYKYKFYIKKKKVFFPFEHLEGIPAVWLWNSRKCCLCYLAPECMAEENELGCSKMTWFKKNHPFVLGSLKPGY